MVKKKRKVKPFTDKDVAEFFGTLLEPPTIYSPPRTSRKKVKRKP